MAKARAGTKVDASLTKVFTDMNDDCILEIFSLLTLKSLCAMKDMSRRLRSLAEDTVERRFRNKYVRFPGAETKKTALSFICKFGGLITHLQIDDQDRFIRSSERNGLRFNSLMKKCTNLKHLRLRKVDFINDVSFSNFLEELHMHSILSLSFTHCKLLSWHLPEVVKSCPKLINFTYDGHIESRGCNAIIQNGQFLKSLCFKNCKYDTMSVTEICNNIARLGTLPKIQNFDVGHVSRSFVLPILRKLMETNSELQTISFDGYLPRFEADNEFFDLIKKLQITCKLYNRGGIIKKLFPAADGLLISGISISHSKKYTYVYTISPSPNRAKLPEQ